MFECPTLADFSRIRTSTSFTSTLNSSAAYSHAMQYNQQQHYQNNSSLLFVLSRSLLTNSEFPKIFFTEISHRIESHWNFPQAAGILWLPLDIRNPFQRLNFKTLCLHAESDTFIPLLLSTLATYILLLTTLPLLATCWLLSCHWLTADFLLSTCCWLLTAACYLAAWRCYSLLHTSFI